MIIHEPEIITDSEASIIWSKIEYQSHHEYFPEYLWYRIPTKYEQYISPQSDAFLVPSLLVGMHIGDNIEVRGAVSPRLAYQINEYQHLLSTRMPDTVRPVDIKYLQVKTNKVNPQGVGVVFSGGVDSLFSVWKHLPENQVLPEYQITHALFVHGFDIMMKDQERYEKLFNRYKRALERYQIELIPLETNIASIMAPTMYYVNLYGPILAGCSLVYGGLFKRMYISSSRDLMMAQVQAYSSTPLSDSLLSTDTLDFIHAGGMYQRIEKLKEISNWDLAHKHLRICPYPRYSEYGLNCSRCEKCVRTMLPLYALGVLDKFKTFAKPLTKNRESIWMARKFNPSREYHRELFPFVKEHKPSLLPWINLAMFLGYLRYWFLRLIPGLSKKWLNRFGFFVDPLKQKFAMDREDIHQLISDSQECP